MMKRNNYEQWELLLSDYRSSGMTSEAWCQSKEIKRNILYYWMRKLKMKKDETDINAKWASIPLPNKQGSSLSLPITLKIGEFSLEIEPGFEKTLLEDVLSVVMQLC